MANYLSKISLGGTTYSLKDTEARTAISTLETAVASSLVFKGVVSSAAEITELTNYKLGWSYKATELFYFPNLGVIENGDMIICISSYSDEYKSTDWTVIQNNVDVMQGATTSTDGARGLVPAPTATDTTKVLSGNGTWIENGSTWGKISDLI